MLPIYILSKNPKKLEEPVCSLLSRRAELWRCGQKSIELCTDADFAVISFPAAENIRMESGVLLLSDPPFAKTFEIHSGVTPIFYSGDRKAQRLLKGCGVPALSCGTGSKDSVSVSSIAKDSLLLSVQREFSAQSGEVIEAREFSFPIPERKYELHLLILAAVCVLAATGQS